MSNILANFGAQTRDPGGKGSAGIFHKIIGSIPRHRVYIDPFVRGGAAA